EQPNLLLRHLRLHRKAQYFTRRALRVFERAACRDADEIRRLQVHWHRIVDGGPDPLALEMLLQRVTIGSPNDILVVNVVGAGAYEWPPHRSVYEELVIHPRPPPSLRVVVIQLREAHPQQGGLQLVESAVASATGADVALFPTVLTQRAHAANGIFVRRDDDAAVTQRREILRGVEAEGGHVGTGPELL